MTINRYQLQKQGNLLTVNAFIPDQQGICRRLTLLVDTGASYTVVPERFLQELGYEVNRLDKKITVTAAGGPLSGKVMSLDRFSCVDCQLDNFSVVVLPFPAMQGISGVLGMDFLLQVSAVIDGKKAAISVEVD